MAVAKDGASNRRRSIAVTNQNRPTLAAAPGRRRAHSIVPGGLSPLAKARRSLVPRKSILKTSIIFNTEETSSQSSQPSQSQSSFFDDGNITQSMDLTTEYHARVHDKQSRKSFGRRVSFAEHAQVRLFQIPETNHTNNTASPQSSPAQPSPEENQPPALSNENDYPASFSRKRRRSSIRNSFAGSEDMNLTSVNPADFLEGGDGSALMDEELDLDDMDVTEVFDELPESRRPFAPVRRRSTIQFPSDDNIPSDGDDFDDNSQTQSFTRGEESHLEHDVEHSQEMEFTVPMGQSLRPPPTEDPIWLALRQVTHSGDTPHEPEPPSEDDITVPAQGGMDLNDAVARLMRARNSLAGGGEDDSDDMDITTANGHLIAQEDSLISSDDSLNHGVEFGNETLNISKIVGRLSLGGDNRMSLGYQDSTMDESGIYGSIVPVSSSTPRPSTAPTGSLTEELPAEVPSEADAEDDFPPLSSVFRPPPTSVAIFPEVSATHEQIQISKTTPFTFVPPPQDSQHSQPRKNSKPNSPVKPKPKPTFSAAFAPPVSKPSPKKPSTTTPSTPNKRPFSVMQDNDPNTPTQPSPAKRQAVTPRQSALGTPSRLSIQSQGRASLSPTKNSSSSSKPANKRPSISYFARRKSLGNGLLPAQNTRNEQTALQFDSPNKQTSRSSGRGSLASAPTDAWTRFDRNASPIGAPTTTVRSATPEQTNRPEASHQGDAQSSPASGSPVIVSPEVVISGATLSQLPVTTPVITVDLADDDLNTNVVVNVDETAATGVAETTEAQPEEEVLSVSIGQFFSITGIKFMDELTAPRRSIHPQGGSRQARNPSDIPLSDYYVAMGIDVPQLGLFTRVSRDLEGWMSKSKAEFSQAEEEATKITPELFVEFMRADEESQAALMHTLNLIRVNARAQAKSDWYDWKLRWVEGLHITAEEAFNNLQSDAKTLEPIKHAAEELVPTLEKEYNEILQQLEHEQAEVAEIEASDQEYLNDLKVSISEQNIEVEALRAELSEHMEQLNFVQGRLHEQETENKEISEAIAKAQRILQIQKNSTTAEVFRLRDELETLEDLHRLRITAVDEMLFEFVYASRYQVTIPCKNYLPVVSSIEIVRVGDFLSKYKDDFAQFSNVTFKASKLLATQSKATSCREVVHQLADYWTSCVQLRSQLELLLVRYPVDIIITSNDGAPNFKARVKVMIPSKKAKIYVSFNFTPEIYSRWPMSLNSLTCNIDVSYGPVDRSLIAQVVTERLSQATPSVNYACLLDACIEAQEIYNQ